MEKRIKITYLAILGEERVTNHYTMKTTDQSMQQDIADFKETMLSLAQNNVVGYGDYDIIILEVTEVD